MTTNEDKVLRKQTSTQKKKCKSPFAHCANRHALSTHSKHLVSSLVFIMVCGYTPHTRESIGNPGHGLKEEEIHQILKRMITE